MASLRKPSRAWAGNSSRAAPTARTISTSAGSSRRARRIQNPVRSIRPVRPSSSSSSEVIRNPLRTKKTSTPRNPPPMPGMPPCWASTSATAIARSPSSAGIPPLRSGLSQIASRPTRRTGATHRPCRAEHAGAGCSRPAQFSSLARPDHSAARRHGCCRYVAAPPLDLSKPRGGTVGYQRRTRAGFRGRGFDFYRRRKSLRGLCWCVAQRALDLQILVEAVTRSTLARCRCACSRRTAHSCRTRD